MGEYLIHKDNELYHFGVKGQKWGVRRYQNEDGSYKNGAEGRYDPDGQSGVNKSGHTLKNRLKSAAGVYKEGDGNPYVSEKRRKIRKTEEESFKEAQEKEDWLTKRRRENKTGKTDSELEDDEIAERADRIQKKNKGMSRRDAESAAEDEMIAEDRARNKANKEAKKAAKEKAKAEKKAAKEQAKAAKKEEKMSKNSYKKIAGKYLLKNVGLTAAGNILGNAVANKTGNTALGLYTNAAIQGTGKTINMIKSGKEAYDLHQYRKRKSTQHSDLDSYDELYHGELGGFYGIKRM